MSAGMQRRDLRNPLPSPCPPRCLASAPQVDWVLKPTLRFEGKPGEQWTCFFRDPSGNNLEFKVGGCGRQGVWARSRAATQPPVATVQAMTKPENLFAKYYVE